MKILFDYCRQTRRYGDDEGYCLVEVEKGDNVEEIKREFQKPKEWYEKTYQFERYLNEYTYDDVTYKGNLLLFRTHIPYLD